VVVLFPAVAAADDRTTLRFPDVMFWLLVVEVVNTA
jgi:hypothetical protein